MTQEEIFEKVKGIIVEQLGVTETSVTTDASFPILSSLLYT